MLEVTSYQTAYYVALNRGIETGQADLAFAGPKFPVIIIAPIIKNSIVLICN